MIKEQFIIQNMRGLHTRAAAKFVDLAKKFASSIELTFNNRSVDGKSIMGVITLGAQKGNIVDCSINGEDEEQAYSAIKTLLDNKFGED